MPRPRESAPFDVTAIRRWLTLRPELSVAGARPTTPDALADHLSQWWLPSEVILYIGKATSLASRVGQYYDTALGAGRPHAGGAWLKTLDNLSELAVHWALTVKPAKAEADLLVAFSSRVTPPATYPDRELVLPWANLEMVVDRRRRRRQHELLGARPPRRRRSRHVVP
jgi:hypothetical protein